MLDLLNRQCGLEPYRTRTRHRNGMNRRYVDFYSLLDDFLSVHPIDWFSDSALEFLGSPLSLGESVDESGAVDGIVATCQVPGYGKENLSVTYSNGFLEIKDKDVDEKAKGSLHLKAKLPKNVEPNTLKAKCVNGILTVNVKYKKNREEEKRPMTVE